MENYFSFSFSLNGEYHILHCIDDIQGGIKCGNREPGSSIAKGLIDSEDLKHTLFCPETAFVAICAFSGLIFPSFDGNSNIFATFIEQKSYQ